MADNSRHPGIGSRNKDNTVGSGGRTRRSLRGKGPTPKAEDYVYHKTYKARQEALKRQVNHPKARTGNAPVGIDQVVSRNLALEALTTRPLLKQAYVAEGAERDDRLCDTLEFVIERLLPLLQIARAELDRVTGGLVHRGVALQLPAFDCTNAEDISDAAFEVSSRGLVTALDQVTDLRNLGAIIRLATAFGTQGVVIPVCRSASMTATAWKISVGVTARIPVARVADLNRILRRAPGVGFTVVGLAGEDGTPLSNIPGSDGPAVVVVGSEGESLARLARENCDALASTPITSAVEPFNALVAVSIVLCKTDQQRVPQAEVSPGLGPQLLAKS